MTQNETPKPADFLGMFNDMLEGAFAPGNKPTGLFDIFAAPAPKPAAKDAPESEGKDAPASPFPNFDMSTVLEDVLNETAPLRKKAKAFFEKSEDAVPTFLFNLNDCKHPPLNVYLTEDSIEYRFAAAGITAEGVEAELDGDRLTVTLTLEDESTEAEVLNREIWSGVSKETFVIPTENKEGLKREIDEENIKASVKEGLVSIVVPFKERIKTKITVS